MKCREENVKECPCGAKGTDIFYWKKTGRVKKNGEAYLIRSALCKKCHNRRTVNRLLNDRPRFLLRSMEKADKKAGRPFSMTIGFIRSVLKGPCSYCDDEVLPLTLDRRDNSRGHAEDNVVVSCIMCNAIRGSMPYEAWLMMAKTLKEVKARGLLDGWSGFHSSKLAYPRL